MAVERVYLIRHGETAWNAEGRWQGHEPLPLNETGFQQARALAAYCRRPLTAVYSSDQLRASQTASTLSEALGVPQITDERLRECHLGIFQGLTRQQMQERYPYEFAQMQADYMDYCIPNGETRRSVQARAYAAFMDIVSKAVGEIAIVTHGGTLQMLMYKLCGESPELRGAHYGNTSITTLEPDGDGWRCVGLAETPHLARHFEDANTVSEQLSSQDGKSQAAAT
jgi:broad specificity phosphatase PhoE